MTLVTEVKIFIAHVFKDIQKSELYWWIIFTQFEFVAIVKVAYVVRFLFKSLIVSKLVIRKIWMVTPWEWEWAGETHNDKYSCLLYTPHIS